MTIATTAPPLLAQTETGVEKEALISPEALAWTEDGLRAACEGDAAYLLFPLDGSYTLAMSPNDDGSSGEVSLGFSFNLYGDTYTSLFINNNGNLSFGAPLGTYSPSGFPAPGLPMVAPFWADVDTRSGNGHVWYKAQGNTFIVTWDNVGYYNQHGDKLNTFQVAISNGANPAMGLGNTVCFSYDNMCWTTGDGSNGVGGFGGIPATVGANRGNGIAAAQIGRFDHNGGAHDGAVCANDGVDYLDGNTICFRTAVAGCGAPSLCGARSVAQYATGEIFRDLDITGIPTRRTSESRGTGIRILDFCFDRPIVSGSITVIPGGITAPMTPGAGTFGQNGGRAVLCSALPNNRVYTIRINASTGPGCDLADDICVVAQVGDVNGDGRVDFADKVLLLNRLYDHAQEIEPADDVVAIYDVQPDWSGRRLNPADVGFLTGFVGNSVVNLPCP